MKSFRPQVTVVDMEITSERPMSVSINNFQPALLVFWASCGLDRNALHQRQLVDHAMRIQVMPSNENSFLRFVLFQAGSGSVAVITYTILADGTMKVDGEVKSADGKVFAIDSCTGMDERLVAIMTLIFNSVVRCRVTLDTSLLPDFSVAQKKKIWCLVQILTFSDIDVNYLWTSP